ncbi:MAG: hypothetical protein U9N02_06295 [Campylobacterota bacterium]|nr:hypothetical protein [Campylobacterota bacterium]
MFIYNDYTNKKQKIEESRLAKNLYKQKQLDEFYIPLEIKLLESQREWFKYKKRYANSKVFENMLNGIENEDTYLWRINMLNIFKSIHEMMSEIISSKRNLALENEELHKQLDLLVSHIYEYKVIFAMWVDGNNKKNIADIKFPNELINLIQEDIKILKNKQR